MRMETKKVIILDRSGSRIKTAATGAVSRVPVETMLLLDKGKETEEEEDVCKRKSRRGGAAKWN